MENNSEIKESEVSNEQKYYLIQVQNLKNKKEILEKNINSLNFDLDQVNAALIHFEFGLSEKIQKVLKEEKSNNAVGGKK
tara:strand:+ start:26 stop:265 length:240 start_codon:yes stop_codon:yes gene_type:complete